jgi:hypothetical protein
MSDHPFPSGDELLAVHRTLDRLQQATWHDPADYGDKMAIWGKIVEAKLTVAQATHGLIDEADDQYHRAWEAMVDAE